MATVTSSIRLRTSAGEYRGACAGVVGVDVDVDEEVDVDDDVDVDASSSLIVVLVVAALCSVTPLCCTLEFLHVLLARITESLDRRDLVFRLSPHITSHRLLCGFLSICAAVCCIHAHGSKQIMSHSTQRHVGFKLAEGRRRQTSSVKQGKQGRGGRSSSPTAHMLLLLLLYRRSQILS